MTDPVAGAAWPTAEDTAAACPVPHAAMPLHGPRLRQDPSQLYREMRERFGPVAPIELEGGVPAWLVLGYREIHQVCSNPEVFARDVRRWNAWDRVPADWGLMAFVAWMPSIGFAEGEEYRRRLRVLGESLEALEQFELQHLCEQAADRLIDEFATTGEADLIAQYALKLPLHVLAEVCGVGRAETAELERDVIASVSLDAGSAAAHQRIADRMRRLVRQRREEPRADLASRMAAHEEELDEDALTFDLLTVMAAGHQTVAHWIGNAVRLMLTDQRFAVGLAGGRRSIGQALNEVLWEDTPTQNYVGRYATQDTEIAGYRIRAGDMLVLGLSAGNTDPAVRPQSYDDAVGNNAFLSFGTGDRGCPHPAPEVAEVIARTAIEVLLDRLPDLALAVHPDSLQWVPSVWVRGLTALPVEFSPGYVVGG